MSRPCISLFLAGASLLAGETAAPPSRLVISRDGAVLHAAGKPGRHFKTLEEIAALLPGFRGQVEVAPAAPGPATGERITIGAGQVPAIELVKLLADTLETTVISQGADRALQERSVLVPRRLDRADEALVQRLLEANRFRVLETRLDDGRRLIAVEDVEAGFEPGEPRARPIVKLDGSSPPPTAAPTSRAARPPPAEVQGYAGVTLEELPEMLRAQVPLELGEGILVSAVDEALAVRSRTLRQLRRFDIVTHVGTRAVSQPAGFVAAFNDLDAGAAFELRILRQGTVKILRGTK
jgi:hypothetical protein